MDGVGLHVFLGRTKPSWSGAYDYDCDHYDHYSDNCDHDNDHHNNHNDHYNLNRHDDHRHPVVLGVMRTLPGRSSPSMTFSTAPLSAATVIFTSSGAATSIWSSSVSCSWSSIPTALSPLAVCPGIGPARTGSFGQPWPSRAP